MKRLNGAAELLDGALDPDILAGNLNDLARVNRWLGGVDLSWRALQPMLALGGSGSSVRLLDVGTGAADIPLALAGRASANGATLDVAATDVRPEIVALASTRARRSGTSSVRVQLAESDRIDAPDGSFDIVHGSMVLHHLDPPAATDLLREMARVASRAVIVNDLDRGWTWWIGAWLLAHATTANRYTRHDAPLSVRRAYRPNEVVKMAAGAGLREVVRYRARPPYRYSLVFERSGSANG